MILTNPSKYPSGVARHVPHWDRMLGTADSKIIMNKGRYLLSEPWTTPPVKMIRALLDKIYEPQFLVKHNMLDLYTTYIMPKASMISRMIDPMAGTPQHHEVFVMGSSITEVIIPTRGIINPSGMSALDEWDDWEFVAPLRLLAHDSIELDTASTDARIRFKKQQPTYVVHGIDVEALIVKYLRYIHDTETDFKTVNREEFISKHIIPYVYDDMLDVWCLNVINYFLGNVFGEEVKTMAHDVSKNNQFLGASSLTAGFNDLKDLTSRVASGNVSIGAFLNTKLVNGKSLLAMMEFHRDIAAISNSTRYRGYELLKTSIFIEILTQLISSVRERSQVSKIIKDVQVDARNYRRSGWAGHIKDPIVKLVGQGLLDYIDII